MCVCVYPFVVWLAGYFQWNKRDWPGKEENVTVGLNHIQMVHSHWCGHSVLVIVMAVD